MSKWQWSSQSRSIIQTCHPALRELAGFVIQESPFDVTVPMDGGARTLGEQQRMFLDQVTEIDGVTSFSKHNGAWDSRTRPEPGALSLAIHFVPYPIDWNDLERFCVLAGVVFTCWNRVVTPCGLRWGGDWDMDWTLKNENFRDYAHYELMPRN